MEKSERAASVCHIVIPAPDLPSAKQFYEKIFKWTVKENHPGPAYWFFESGNLGGAFDSKAQPAQGSIVLVIEVEDMPATIQSIIRLGGSIVQDRSRIGEAAAGYDAYFLDPNGNKVGIYSRE
jgi:predicted enzyme related to lactoylglutathione lyase